jgi:hypothetical protein
MQIRELLRRVAIGSHVWKRKLHHITESLRRSVHASYRGAD